MNEKNINIIGVSAGYHDSACCLIQNGVLIAAAQEERFSRIKHDKSFPRKAFRYCLEQAECTICDIDAIAYYEDPVQKMSRQIWMGLIPDLPISRRRDLFSRLMSPDPKHEIRMIFGYEGPVEIIDHHLSHSASAYYYSGFEEAAILTVDGVGDWPTTTMGFGKGANLERLEQVDFPDSLGFFYSTITSYLGFDVNDGEYKVMGLAPYGEPRYVDQLLQLVEDGDAAQYRLNMQYFDFLRKDCMYSDALISLLGRPPRDPESEILPFHQDLARSMQAALEEILLNKARYLHRRIPCDNLCMAGGVALNCVANSRILRDGPFENLFVQPAAGDSGASLGAAALAYVRRTGKPFPKRRMEHVYLGPGYSGEVVGQIFQGTSAEILDFRGDERSLILATVDRLMEGKVIGWFQGRMEFGPRSLGARSILADPRDPSMRDRINALVKKREAFRPFAPAALESKAAEHFDLDHASPFMLETCQVISEQKLPAITHVDGSARLQTVNRLTNPRFVHLLEEFDARTGCPILLNTSFNVRGEPIVCTIEDAIACYTASGIDCLIIEDFIIDRERVPNLWDVFAFTKAMRESNQGKAISHLVYTLL
jgi:carbamoyltransferase